MWARCVGQAHKHIYIYMWVSVPSSDVNDGVQRGHKGRCSSRQVQQLVCLCVLCCLLSIKLLLPFTHVCGATSKAGQEKGLRQVA